MDAELTGWGPFPDGGYRQEVDLKVQLKATVKTPVTVGDCFSYSLSGIKRYDDLRTDAISTPRILVVLFLPPDGKDWLSHTEESLMLRNCAYWVSLRGAHPSSNTTAQTVYLPRDQKFNPDGLIEILAQVSKNEFPVYQAVAA